MKINPIKIHAIDKTHLSRDSIYGMVGSAIALAIIFAFIVLVIFIAGISQPELVEFV